MKRKLVLLTAVLLLFIVPQVSAATPTTSLQTFSGEACPTGSAKYAVQITNPGNAPDTYTVETNIPWSTVAPSTIEVQGGETDSAYIWLQPPRDMQPGTHDFTVTVTSSNTGESTTTTGQIEVLSCRAVALTAQQTSQNVCRGETATYDITVRNTGRAQETYQLAASAGALSAQQVTLAPGETREVTLQAASDQATQQTLRVRAESTTSFAQDEIELQFEAERCRNAELFVSPSENRVCEGEPAEFRITARNTGRIQDTYTLSTNVQGANVDSLQLDPGESRTFKVTVNEDTGEHTIVARLSSQNQPAIRLTENAVMHVENCYDIVVTTQAESVQLDQTGKTLLEFGIGNNGTRTTTVDLAFDGPEWADFRPREMTLQPGQQKLGFLYLAPDFLSEEGTYTGKLSITGANGRIDRVIDVDITVGDGNVTTEPNGQDQNGEPAPSPANGTNGNGTDGGNGATGNLLSDTAGLVALLVVLAALFVGGYWLFRKRRGDEDDEGPVDEDRDDGVAGTAAASEAERERRREDVRERIRQRRQRDEHAREQTEEGQPADRNSIREQVGGRRERDRDQPRDEHGRFTGDQNGADGEHAEEERDDSDNGDEEVENGDDRKGMSWF